MLITDDGEELPLPRLYDDDSDDEHASSPPESVLDDKAAPVEWDSAQDATLTSSLWGTPSASPRPVLAQLPEDETVQPPSTPSSPFISKTRRLLKLALPLPSRGLDLRLTPSASSSSSDVFSSSMSALFRVGSRDSSRTSGSRASSRERLADDSSTIGAPLGRCSSAASAASGRSTSTLRPSLLAFRRTQSSDNVEKLRSSGSTTPRSGRPAARTASVGQQGTRMLNGRVYGGRRGHQFKTNPFETARNEEPEFVEWGYGGMGSNKTAKDSAITSKYAALHGGASTGDDDDDGSGLAWLKARREKRAAEEAAKAAAAASAEKPESAEPAAAEEKKEGEALPTEAAAELSVESSAHPASSAPAQAKKMPEYVHSTVSVPASPGLPTVHEGIVAGSEDANAASSVSVATVSEEGSSSSEEEEERSSEGTSPEEEEDEEMLEAIRKTSVCAGVEKVSRHKE